MIAAGGIPRGRLRTTDTRHKLLALFLVATGVLLVMTWLAWERTETLYDAIQSAGNRQRAILNAERSALQAQVHFKVQVQEWKNILLRGKDAALYDKYLEAFNQEFAQVEMHLADVRKSLVKAGLDMTSEVGAASAQLGTLKAEYLAAIVPYRGIAEQGGDAAAVVDVAVRGKDRAPTETIGRIAESLRVQADAVLAEQVRLEDERRHEGYQGVLGFLMLALLMMTCVDLVMFFWIARPLARLEHTISEIARTDDLTLQAEVRGHDEIGRMAAAFNRLTRMLCASREELRQLAFVDGLTKLPNRRLFMDRLQHGIQNSKRHSKHGAVLFIDLNKFKQLNDTHGHEAGDLLLIEVARRLCDVVRVSDTVARLGGDEFVVLIEDLDNQADVAQRNLTVLIDKLRHALAEDYVLGDIRHSGSASVGSTLFYGGNVSAEALLKRADAAMYEAKKGSSVLR